MTALANLYAEINQRGQQALLNHQEEVDPYLAGRPDDRRGLSLILRLPAHVSRNIGFAVQELRAVDPGLYLYPATDMHITVLDVIGARSQLRLSKDQLKSYYQVIRRVATATPAISWRLKGLMLSPGAVMVKGYYSSDLQKLRSTLRTALHRAGLPIQERYQTRSGHVTIARFRQSLQHPRNLVRLVDENRGLAFGEFTATQLDLVVHDWYNHHCQIGGTVCLAE